MKAERQWMHSVHLHRALKKFHSGGSGSTIKECTSIMANSIEPVAGSDKVFPPTHFLNLAFQPLRAARLNPQLRGCFNTRLAAHAKLTRFPAVLLLTQMLESFA